MNETLTTLAQTLVLGHLLERAREMFGGYELVTHWQQGEFHHDVVLRLPTGALASLPGCVLVVATNCNGGIKEVLCFDEVPERLALWHFRCPQNPEFVGPLAPLLGREVTVHWFDPCELLHDDARSELSAPYRERQAGGGWQMRATKACGHAS